MKVSFGGRITLVRVGGQGGEMVQEMRVDVFFWGGADWSRQTNQTNVRWDGKTDEQTDEQGQTEGWRKWKQMSSTKAGDGETRLDTSWHKLYFFSRLKAGQWTHREKFQKSQISVTAGMMWSWGSEQDGLVHLYCLENTPNIPVCSSIIHSVLLFPSKLPPRPSKFSLSLSHSFFHSVCSSVSVLRASEYKSRYIKDEWAWILP